MAPTMRVTSSSPSFLAAAAALAASWATAPCPAAAEPAFVDITGAAGTGGPTARNKLGGHGAFFADVDGDGRPDLYITMVDDHPTLDLFFRNAGDGRFAEEAVLRGLFEKYDAGTHGFAFADLDNDGDYDFFRGQTCQAGTVIQEGHAGPCEVHRNDGKGHFANATPACMAARKEFTRGVLAFDMDGDGDLDLLAITNYQGSKDPPGDRNEVYRNDGGWKFTALTSGALYEAPAGQSATDTDFDGDGDVDVIAANRTGPLNVLLNDGKGNFTAVPPESLGLSHPGPDGISAADVDNDGRIDLLLSGDGKAHLYLNDGKGKFAHRQAFEGVRGNGYMGGFADLDNDGDLDLAFPGDPVVYLNDGKGNFAAGPQVPVGAIDDPRAIAFADIDGDGDLDFALAVKRSRNRLFRNDFARGHWLKVRLISPQGQAGAFGAKTRVYPAGQAGGPLLGLRESKSNQGYLAQDDPVLHFGLGERTAVDVVVTFLDGTVAKRSNAAADATLTVDGRKGR